MGGYRYRTHSGYPVAQQVKDTNITVIYTLKMSSQASQMTLLTLTHQFNEKFTDLISFLLKISPDAKKIKKVYKSYLQAVDSNTRLDYIENFTSMVSKYITEISTCDEGLFSEESCYYPNQPIELLKGIDFKLLWGLIRSESETKAKLWSQYQTLYIISTHIMKTTQRQTVLLKRHRELLNNMKLNFKLQQQIQHDADAQLEAESKQQSQSEGFDFSKLSELFSGNGKSSVIMKLIMDIAKDLAEELKSSVSGVNPMEMIKSLMNPNGGYLNQITERVSAKLQEKILSGVVSKEDLMKEAQDLHQNLMGKCKGIPGLEQLTKKLTEQFSTSSPSDASVKNVSMEDMMAEFQKVSSELGLNAEMWTQAMNDGELPNANN
jgi:hypothetical protein